MYGGTSELLCAEDENHEEILGRMLKKTVSEAAADGSTGGVASGLR
jgi:hypothetical protein